LQIQGQFVLDWISVGLKDIDNRLLSISCIPHPLPVQITSHRLDRKSGVESCQNPTHIDRYRLVNRLTITLILLFISHSSIFANEYVSYENIPLPPGMSHASDGPPQRPAPRPRTVAPQQHPATPAPSAPVPRANDVIRPLEEILPPALMQHRSTLGDAIPPASPHLFGPLLLYMVGTLVIMSAIPFASKKHRRRTLPAKSAGIAPPPLLTPPPIPNVSPRGNLMDLMERRANLMTPAELAFYSILSPIVGSSFMISSKVRLADLFQSRDGRGQKAAFNKIVGKHVDFVIVHPSTSRILCGIELDDRSHPRPDRIERDRFVNEPFASNHLPLIRIPVARFYDPGQLKSLLLKAGVALEKTPAQ